MHESALTIHVPDSAYSVASIRVATVGPWARARLVPGPGRVIQPALVVLSRQGAGWRLRDVGTVDVGCGIVPPTSRSDLALRCATVGPSFVSCVPPVPNFHQLHAYQVSCITARQVAMAVFSSATSSPPAGWSCTHHAIVQPGGIHSVYWSCTHAGSWRVTWIDHTE